MHIFQEQVVPGNSKEGAQHAGIPGGVGSLASSQLLLTAESHGLTATATSKDTKNRQVEQVHGLLVRSEQEPLLWPEQGFVCPNRSVFSGCYQLF